MTLEKRVERQRRLVTTLEQRLLFERLVLQRLEGRQSRDEASEPPETISTLGDVYRAACKRAAR